MYLTTAVEIILWSKPLQVTLNRAVGELWQTKSRWRNSNVALLLLPWCRARSGLSLTFSQIHSLSFFNDAPQIVSSSQSSSENKGAPQNQHAEATAYEQYSLGPVSHAYSRLRQSLSKALERKTPSSVWNPTILRWEIFLLLFWLIDSPKVLSVCQAQWFLCRNKINSCIASGLLWFVLFEFNSERVQ